MTVPLKKKCAYLVFVVLVYKTHFLPEESPWVPPCSGVFQRIYIAAAAMIKNVYNYDTVKINNSRGWCWCATVRVHPIYCSEDVLSELYTIKVYSASTGLNVDGTNV